MATSLPFATTTWLPLACTRRMGDELGDQRGTGVQRIKAEGGSSVVCLPCTTRQSGWLGGCFRVVEGGFETRRAKRRETATADLPCPRSAKSAAPVRHAVRSGCRGRPRHREWGRRLTATTACLSSGMTPPDHHMKPCVLSSNDQTVIPCNGARSVAGADAHLDLRVTDSHRRYSPMKVMTSP